jgi:hypothetical protein
MTEHIVSNMHIGASTEDSLCVYEMQPYVITAAREAEAEAACMLAGGAQAMWPESFVPYTGWIHQVFESKLLPPVRAAYERGENTPCNSCLLGTLMHYKRSEFEYAGVEHQHDIHSQFSSFEHQEVLTAPN